MNILITGNQGYIGSVLSPYLVSLKYSIRGFDTGYFERCNLTQISENFHQIKKDIRNIEEKDIEGVDAVIHLAALSNDPLGELAPGLTEEINLVGTIRTAELAKKVGVKRFIYSSSQSMYGISNSNDELDEIESEKNPLTAYAKTKWEAECQLSKMNSDSFQIVSFRPSTVFGVSPRLRCDIVYNNLVGSAFTTGNIEIKSDGTPWRPVVHIKDVCDAFLAGLKAPAELVSGKAFNVGIPNGNFSVRDLAEAAQKSVKGSNLKFMGEHGSDSRTYKVSFKRILTELRDYYQPKWDLIQGGVELESFFRSIEFSEDTFRGNKCNRLIQIRESIDSGKLNSNLKWQ